MAETASCPPSRADGSGSIAVASYNIRNGRNGGLESPCRAMAAMDVDLGIFQETKITDGIYTRLSSGYSVVASNAASVHQGGIALFWRPNKSYEVEDWRVRGLQRAVVCDSYGGGAILRCGVLYPTEQSQHISNDRTSLERVPDRTHPLPPWQFERQPARPEGRQRRTDRRGSRGRDGLVQPLQTFPSEIPWVDAGEMDVEDEKGWEVDQLPM
jgi:hypothetical protein